MALLRPCHGRSPRDPAERAFAWGYGHYFVFGSGAAVGAGLGVWIDFETGHAAIGGVVVGYALATPVAVYLTSLWALHLRRSNSWVQNTVLPVTAAVVLATPMTPEPVLATGLVVATALALKLFHYWRARD